MGHFHKVAKWLLAIPGRYSQEFGSVREKEWGRGQERVKNERKGRKEGGEGKGKEGRKEGWFSPGNSKKHPRM